MRLSLLSTTHEGVTQVADDEGVEQEKTPSRPFVGGNLVPCTIKDIAKQVEVSTATVSRAMNGSEMCPAKQESQSSLQFQCCGIAQTYTRPNWVE